MKFNLILLVNLVAVITRGRLCQASHQEERDECLRSFERFQTCETAPTENVTYTQDAIPYVCLVSSAMLIELCHNKYLMNEVQQFNETQYNKTVCPLTYKSKNPVKNVSLEGGINYLSDRDKCIQICKYNSTLASDCKIMMFLSEILSKNNEDNQVQGEETNTDPRKSVSVQIKQLKKVDQSRITLDKSSVKKDKVLQESGKTEDKKPVQNKDDGPKWDEEANNIAHEQDNIKNSQTSNHANEPTDIKKVMSFDKHLNMTEPNTIPEANKNNLVETDTMPTEFHDPGSYLPNYNKKEQYSTLYKSIDDVGDEDIGAARDKSELPNRETDYDKSIIDTKEFSGSDNFFRAEDSHFSVYFLMTVSIIILGYIIYHNKNKVSFKINLKFGH